MDRQSNTSASHLRYVHVKLEPRSVEVHFTSALWVTVSAESLPDAVPFSHFLCLLITAALTESTALLCVFAEKDKSLAAAKHFSPADLVCQVFFCLFFIPPAQLQWAWLQSYFNTAESLAYLGYVKGFLFTVRRYIWVMPCSSGMLLTGVTPAEVVFFAVQ